MTRRGAEETGIHSPQAEIALDLLGFAVTAAFAYLEQWNARDLAWGLWSSSLFVGYVSLLTASFSSIRTYHPIALIFTTFYALYLVAFFTIHFGGFHLGHAIFLNSFLPLIPSMTDQISEGMIFNLLQTSFSTYWPLILGSFIRTIPAMIPDHKFTQGEMLFRPYLNVLRMHFFIFVLVFLKSYQLQSWTVLVLLLLYFFPWRMLFPRRADRRSIDTLSAR